MGKSLHLAFRAFEGQVFFLSGIGNTQHFEVPCGTDGVLTQDPVFVPRRFAGAPYFVLITSHFAASSSCVEDEVRRAKVFRSVGVLDTTVARFDEAFEL